MPVRVCSVLKARVPICKTIRNTTKEPYPNVLHFKSSSHDISTIEQLYQVIKQASSEGACLLKGELDRELNWESRAGHTDPDKPTSWACLDLDYLASIASVDDFLAKINGTDISYVLQWSASYGVNGNFFIRAHLFFLLDQPHAPDVLKLWLKQVNLQTFPSDLTLTKTHTALRWGLDITTCQNDKLIFVTPPICYPSSINHFTGERIVLVKKAKDYLSIPADMLPVARVKALEETKINELRTAAGLEPRRTSSFKMKDLKGESYLPNPDQATVTGVKREREFVYLNLNGVDSWAYWHPVDNPNFIYNFKGEPTYKTQELCPDYWYALKKQKSQAQTQANAGKLFLAFRDVRTGEYRNGWYDEGTEEITLHPARSERQINDFLVNYGQPVPETVPIWSVIYDPHAPPIDLKTKTVNTFRPSKYMKLAKTRQDHKPFPTIDRITKHVMGESCARQWYNWLAYMYQKLEAPGTAWVWHGVQGTGKGVLFHKILALLFGADNVAMKRMEELEDKFNGHLEGCLLCFIDEAQISDSGRSKMIMANLKNQITEPIITIRNMRMGAYAVTNRAGWIFASNMPDAVVVATNDRRFNVGEYQAKPIELTLDDFTAIENELLDFAVFLRLYEVDEKAVREPLKNEAKEQLILVSRNSADVVAQALLDGQMHQLWDALPSGLVEYNNQREADAYHHFKNLMHALVQEKREKITREELYAIFNFCVGNVSSSPWKLTSYLKHHGIELKKIRMNEAVTMGMYVIWKDPQDWFDERRAEIAKATQPTLKAVK